MNSQRKQQSKKSSSAVRTDKNGVPLNFGNYKNGRLVANKGKGGKGGKGGGGKGSRGGGGGGGGGGGNASVNPRAAALLEASLGVGNDGGSATSNKKNKKGKGGEKPKPQDVAGHVGLTRDAHAIIHEALQNHTIHYDDSDSDSDSDGQDEMRQENKKKRRQQGSSPDLRPPTPLAWPAGSSKGGRRRQGGRNKKQNKRANDHQDDSTDDTNDDGIYMGPMASQRRTLPVYSYRSQLLSTISSNRATVVEGETGSGKTTQVPQYVLEEAAKHGRTCNIIVAQPRRVSAMSVAERVASERGEQIGGTVGYSIRLERKATANTRLLFCTTGILLKRLEDDVQLTNVTHVFVDEVHERSLEGDFLLMVLRDLIPERERLARESNGRIPPLKIVLMSATLDASLFHDYFWGAPAVKFPGRTFPVTELYLEDAMEVTGHVVRGNEDWVRKGGGGGKGAGDKNSKGRPPLKDDPRLVPLPDRDDEYLDGMEMADRYVKYSPSVQNNLAKIDHGAINYTLVVETIAWLSKLPSPESATEYLNGSKNNRGRGPNKPQLKRGMQQPGSNADADGSDTTSSAILVFLPGIKEITTLLELLQQSPAFRTGQARDWVLPIHSTIPPEEQRLVFKRPPKGVRKVVLATNIAETAITIDDVAFVVDTGRMKETRYDPLKRMSSLEDCLVARSNARQRRGRAGRVRPGCAVHLFTRHRHDRVAAAAQDPEVRRVPLEQLVLRIKALKYPGTAAEVCARLVEPPSEAAVKRAVDELKFLEAMTVNARTGAETMTPLGVHLSHLPVDCRIGKLILLGAMFGVANDALTIAATLSYRSPFQSPIARREEADRCKMGFATAQSDHLTVVRAYNEVDSIKGHAKYDFCRENFLSIKTLQTIAGLKRQFLELLSAAGFVRPGLRSRGVESLGRKNGGCDGVALALEQGLGDRRFDGGRGKRGGRATQNRAMPGDWECDVPSCQAINFARNTRCFKCRADKPDKPYVYTAEEEKKEEDIEEDIDSDDDADSWLGGDEDELDGEGNNQPILKALLVAGLFPQMVMLEEGKKGKKGKGSPKLVGKPEHNGEKPEDMALHPSSIAGNFINKMDVSDFDYTVFLLAAPTHLLH